MTGRVARTVTSIAGTPAMEVDQAVTSVAKSDEIAAPMRSFVRAMPSPADEPARAAYLAPSAAASRSVFRTCNASASCTTASASTVSRMPTSVNSATADPRSSRTSDAAAAVARNRPERLRTRGRD
jgi:hypothetical protein